MSVGLVRRSAVLFTMTCGLSAFTSLLFAAEISAQETAAIVLGQIEEASAGSIDRDFQIWLIDELGKLDANQAWPIIAVALDSSDENVVLAALVGASMRSANDYECLPVRSFIDRLHVLSTADSAKVRQYARRILEKSYAESADAEAWIVPMLKGEDDPSAAVDLIVLLNRNGIETHEAKRALIEIAETSFGRVGHRAVSVLAAQTQPTADALPVVMSYLLSNDYTADPALTQSLPKFGAQATYYVPVLRQLRAKLSDELRKPHAERTIAIYNDTFYVSQLDQTIDLLVKMDE